MRFPFKEHDAYDLIDVDYVNNLKQQEIIDMNRALQVAETALLFACVTRVNIIHLDRGGKNVVFSVFKQDGYDEIWSFGELSDFPKWTLGT